MDAAAAGDFVDVLGGDAVEGAVVSENVDRQNFNPIEEAYAVQSLVAEFGSNRAVAQHFERVDGWITQRILLTHLAPEVQDLVRKKAMPLDAARSLGKLARDNEWAGAEQLAWWQAEQKQRTAASAERSAAKKAAKKTAAPKPLTGEPPARREQQGTDPFYGRKTDPADPAPREPDVTEQKPPANAAREGAPSVPGQATPAEATAGGGGRQPKLFPYEDGVDAARYLILKMPTDELNKMLDLLNTHRESQAISAG
ncbi:ParB/RepB/Spo0J family partition protein [Streptomyces sp. NPDC058316]|uniref:ParB/RepB/Spo0J family partition protein n=1 Tax=Streptomyces sp. NPDC058316 TaxID=3346442 RepID=UPI0036E670A9